MGTREGVLILTRYNSIPSTTRSYLETRKDEFRAVAVYGGPAIISDSKMQELFGYAAIP